MATTQQRLATGKKVNSDLSGLLDGIGQGINAITAAQAQDRGEMMINCNR